MTRPLDLPAGLSEVELLADLRALAARTTPASELVSFLGAGIYDHYVPAVVDAITSRSEFQTAYTPYQPERSQGVLQAIFEFQTAICELTGMEVANASMYDGGDGARRGGVPRRRGSTRRGRVVLSAGVHPEYRQVRAHDGGGLRPAAASRWSSPQAALTDLDALRAAVDADTAAVVVQQPNFFGGLEDLAAAAAVAHDAGALFIAVVDPLSLGLLAPPGDYRRRHRRRRGAVARQPDELRRPRPRLHGRRPGA